jgi:hypothetical protein
VKRVSVGQYLKQFDNVGVIQGLHYSDFSEQLLKAAGVQLRLVDDLYRHLGEKNWFFNT